MFIPSWVLLIVGLVIMPLGVSISAYHIIFGTIVSSISVGAVVLGLKIWHENQHGKNL
jgi:hypothetical protein